MEEIILPAYRREVVRKRVNVLRNEGKLPAVLYGHMIDTTPIMFDYRESSRILERLSASTLVVIEVDGEPHFALVREKQRDVLKGTLLHVDFQAVSLTEKVRAEVALEMIGEAPAAKELGGLILVNIEQLEVEALPRDLPDRIEVDISTLDEIGSAIYVRDIVLSGDVSILADLDEPIVIVTLPMVEEVEEEAVEEEEILEGGEPQVIEKGKREEEEESSSEE